MSLGTACPRLAELDALAKGYASTEDTVRLRRHIKECEKCRKLFNSLSSATLPIRSINTEATAYPFLAPPLAPDELGRLGNFRVLRVLGQGGMGIVFLAEDITLARSVALKVMRPEQKADPEGWQRFLREARAMASIKHEHLATVYQAGEEHGVAFFAMELLEGESLDARARREPAPQAAEIIAIGRQIAKGLAFIHDKNLIHRDIKPANIWLEQTLVNGNSADPEQMKTIPLAPNHAKVSDRSENVRVKILDLGLVREVEAATHLTATGVIMGTPDYMSPEQASGEAVDPRTDLFSLGAVLYYLATGRKPFEAPTLPAVLMALASKTPNAVHEINRQIPRVLSDLVMALLARNPQMRPASAQEVIARLDAIDADIDVAVDAIQSPKTVKKKKKEATRDPHSTQISLDIQRPSSNGVAVGLGIAAVCLLVFLVTGIGGLVAWQFLTPRPAAPPDKKGPIAIQKPPAPPPANGAFLTQLNPVEARNWPFKKGGPDGKKRGPKADKDIDQTVRIQGQIMPNSIFMHPPTPPNDDQPASLTYKLDGKFSSFAASVSINDGPLESEAPCTFYVFGDGRLLWKSNPVKSQADAQECKVELKQVHLMRISVTCDGLPKGAHAVWIEPTLSK